MKKVVIYIAGILVVLSIVLIVIFVIKNRTSEDQLIPPEIELRGVIVSEPDVVPGTFPFKMISLDGLRVIEYVNRGFDDDFKKAELRVAYEISGNERIVRVPLVEKVMYVEVNGVTAEATEVVYDSRELPLKQGDYVGVIFYYLDEEIVKEYDKDDILNYCEVANDEACLSSLDAGFGSITIDFDSYFQEISNGQNNEKLDLTKIAVAQIVKIVGVE